MERAGCSIAVVIPTYNRARLVGQAVESVLAQTRPPDEVIVVDDGSDDDTAAVLASYSDQIRYLYQENRGKSAALNHAFKMVKADYVWILDDDDIGFPDALERHLNFLNAHQDVDFSYSGCYFFRGEQPPAEYDRSMLYDGIDAPAAEFFLRSMETFPCHTGGMLVPLVCYRQVGAFDETLTFGEDYDMTLRLARHFRAGKLARPTFLLRLHEGSRGPADERRAAAEREAVWRVYEWKTFLRLRQELSLKEYLPKGVVENELSSSQSRQALFQRACIMSRHGLFDQALEDIDAATDHAAGDSFFTGVEQQLCARMMNIEPAPLEGRAHFLRKLARLLSRRAPPLFDGCVRGLSWSLRREIKSRNYSNVVEISNYIRGFLNFRDLVPFAARTFKRFSSRAAGSR